MEKRKLLAVSALLAGTIVVGSGASLQADAASHAKNITIGIVSISTSDWLNSAVIKGVENIAKKNGWKVDVVNANGNVQDANSAIQDFVRTKVSGIMDLVFPATNLRAGLAAAQSAGIPVETWGGGLAPGVAASNGDGGPFAVPIVKAMVNTMHGKGSVLALTYHVGRVAQQRETVLDSMLSKYPGIKVTKEEVAIPGDFQSGYNFAMAWLASHPKGSGNLAIWGSWDDPALGAAAAVKQEHRTDVKIYGENGEPAVLESIKSGQFTAVEWENGVAEGQQLANVLPQILKQGSKWKPRTYTVPGELVTARNVKSFLASHPGGFQK